MLSRNDKRFSGPDAPGKLDLGVRPSLVITTLAALQRWRNLRGGWDAKSILTLKTATSSKPSPQTPGTVLTPVRSE